MGPDELFSFMNRFNDKGSAIRRSVTSNNKSKNGYSSTNEIDEDENQRARHETSLNKNTINTPKNMRRFTFMKANNSTSNALIGSEKSNDQENKHISLPKTASTINNNRTHTASEMDIDRKQISKELLSQVHFCRFVYKLIQRINSKIDGKIAEGLREKMNGVIFLKLNQVQKLSSLEGGKASEYKKTADFQKICQIVDQYQKKY